jgi:hypothetical protein
MLKTLVVALGTMAVISQAGLGPGGQSRYRPGLRVGETGLGGFQESEETSPRK